MIRAIGYARVSSVSQKEHGTSLNDQLDKIANFIEKKGWESLGVFFDNQTGSSMDKRDELMKIIDNRDNWDVLIVTKPDRLSRSLGDCDRMFKEIFEPEKKNVWSIDYAVNLTVHPEMRIFTSAVANVELRYIHERSRQGMNSASHDGYWIGKAPYGYTVQAEGKSSKGRKILVTNDDAPQVAEIFHLAAVGFGHSHIAKETGVGRTTVISILKNPIHYGFRKLTSRETQIEDGLILGKTKTIKWVRHKYEIIPAYKWRNTCWSKYKIKDSIK